MNRIPARFSLKYIAALVVLIASLAFTGSALISMSYEKAIVKYLNGYLEEHLMTRLTMDDNIRFRFLRGFPNTTIEIKNVLLLSGADFSRKDFRASYSDTLLFAPSAYLRFNPFKMMRKEYELKKIEISHATINILFDKQNRHNLKIWKSGPKKSPGYSIKLKNIIISDTKLRVQSLRNSLNLQGRSVKTNFRGSLSSNVLSGETKGHFRIRQFTLKDKNISANSDLQLALNIIYSGDRFRISTGTVRYNKAAASVSGEYIAGKDNEVDVKINMEQFGLEELMSIVPVKIKSGKYEFNGKGTLQLLIKGSLSNSDRLSVSSSFVLDDCIARNTATHASITDLNLSGVISGTNASNFHLRADTFYARLGKGKLSGNFSIRDLNNLHFVSDFQTDIDLRELSQFLALDSTRFKGLFKSSFSASGDLKKMSASSLKESLSLIKNGRFSFDQVNITDSRLPYPIEKITGSIEWKEFIIVDSLSLTLNGTDLNISGEIKNLDPYLKGTGILKPDLNVYTDNLLLSNYINKERKKSVHSGTSINIPYDIFLKARLEIKKFTAGKFEAEEVSANLVAVKDSLLLNQLKLKFPDGSIQGTALIKSEPGRNYSITCRAMPQNINIHQLFYVFNNFTQNFILDKNLKGQLSGAIDFYGQWDSTYRIIPASVKAVGDIQILNGELVQFEPMLKLSKYIDVDELRHIRFRTLKNSIFISDRHVSIPEMNINSSAFNISVSGDHSFDNVFDYRLRVLLSEVLFNKARKKKKEINEFYVEETPADQTTIPLIIAGTPANFDVKFDRKKAFSLSKNRKNVNTQIPKTEHIKVEWDEPKDIPVERPAQSSDASGVVIEWEE